MIRSSVLTLAAAGAALIGLQACSSVDRMRGWMGSPCHDTTVSLYFDTGSDAVPDLGLQIVGATAKRLRQCRVREIRLLGLADSSGSPEANLDLSKRRADHVLDAFVSAGLPVPKYTLTAAGDKGAVTAKGAIEPVRRRVDVTVAVGR